MTQRMLCTVWVLSACGGGETVPPAVEITPEGASLAPREQQQLSANVTGGAAGRVVWQSSNEAVATVTTIGRVEALAAGSATVRAAVEGTSARRAGELPRGYVGVDRRGVARAAVGKRNRKQETGNRKPQIRIRGFLFPVSCFLFPVLASSGLSAWRVYPRGKRRFTMRSLVVPTVLALGLWMAPAISRAELPLRVPEGWDSSRQGAALVMVPRGVAAGHVYTVVVPDLTMKVGSVRGLLDVGKASLGEAGTFRPSGEPARGRNEAGWEYDVVIGPIEKDGKVIYAQVMGLKKGDDEGIILVVSDSVETMTTYSDAFTAMIKALGATAAAPAARVEGGKVDLRYRVPAGWSSKAVEGGVLLEKSMNTMYDKYTYRVVILPSEPLRDSLRNTFLASWSALVVPALQTTIAPLPFMRRLASGTACAYDTDSGATAKDGSRVAGGLILLARGTRYVPIFVFFAGATGKELEADLTALIESAEIPGAGDGAVALFAEAQLTGEWNTSSSSFASYVTSSGAYAGDASITTAETVILAADHSFKRSFIGVKSQLVVKEGDAGKWSLDDMRLLQTGKEKRTNWVLGVGSDPKVGAFLVLSTYSNVEEKASFSNPRGAFQGTWFKRKP